MNKKTVILTAIIGLILLVVIGLYIIDSNTITAKTVHKPTKVKIGYRGQLFYLPAYIAETRGYFEEQGLDAELVEFDSTNQLVEAVINGNLDAGVGGVNSIVLLTIEQKTPGLFKIFNLGYYEKGDAILVAKDSDIKEIKDLKGKTISSFPGTAAMKWLEDLFEKHNMPREINIIQTSPSQQLNALSSGSTDAIYVLEPLVTIGVEKGSARVLVDSPINQFFKAPVPFITSMFATDFVENNPETAHKIVLAVDKTIEFIDEHPEEVRQYYSDYTPVDDSIESKLVVAKYVTSDSLNIQDFQAMTDRLTEAGIIEGSVQVEPLFYREGE